MNSHRQPLGGDDSYCGACSQDAGGDGACLSISSLSSSCIDYSVRSMERTSVSIMGVSGWVMLQIAIGVLVAVSWSCMRRRKKVKGGQPRLGVNINALTESPATLQESPVPHKKAYSLDRSSIRRSGRSQVEGCSNLCHAAWQKAGQQQCRLVSMTETTKLKHVEACRRVEAVRGAAWAKGVASHPQPSSRPYRSPAADSQHVDKPGIKTWSSLQVSEQDTQ